LSATSAVPHCCAKLFIIAENEELFDNKDHAILARERAAAGVVAIPLGPLVVARSGDGAKTCESSCTFCAGDFHTKEFCC
jgi:hypothetical protein